MFYFLMLLFVIGIFIGTSVIVILTFKKIYYIIDILIIVIIFLMRYFNPGLNKSFLTIANYYPNFLVLRCLFVYIFFSIKKSKGKLIKLSTCSMVHICLIVINSIINLLMFLYFFNFISLIKK